jgi:hypothetical protein
MLSFQTKIIEIHCIFTQGRGVEGRVESQRRGEWQQERVQNTNHKAGLKIPT